MSGAIIWFTGLSGAGKSTLAEAFGAQLRRRGKVVTIIDGDTIRRARKRPLGFSREHILQNGRDIVEACKQEAAHSDFVLVGVITPFAQTRREARVALEPNYFEVYVATSVDVCAERDTKGLYKQAIAGELPNLVGVSETTLYEPPRDPELVVDTASVSVEEARDRVSLAVQAWQTTRTIHREDLMKPLIR